MNGKTLVILPIVSVMFLASAMQPHASFVQHDSSPNLEEQAPSNEQLILLYLSCGNVNLMSQNYSSALDDYQKALGLLTNARDNDMEFLILFGMTIACDNLHLTDLCEFNISRIRALINSPDEEEDGVTEYMTAEDDKVPSYLRTLADMSPSIEIRDALRSFISEIFPPSLTSLSPFGNYTIPSHFHYERHVMMHPCKSVWKKIEKFGRKVRRTCEKILDIIERCLDIKDRIQGKPQPKLSYQSTQERII